MSGIIEEIDRQIKGYKINENGQQTVVYPGVQPQHRVIEINAPTGYGKSTLVPSRICIILGGKTLFLVPTVTAVHYLRSYVEQLGFKNLKIGYAAESEKKYDDSHNYVIATYGHGYRIALRSLEAMNSNEDVGLSSFRNVIFDEYHHQDANIPQVAAIYRYFIERDIKNNALRTHRAFFMTATGIDTLPGGMNQLGPERILNIQLGVDAPVKYVTVYRGIRESNAPFDKNVVSRIQLDTILKRTAEVIGEVLGVIPTISTSTSGGKRGKKKSNVSNRPPIPLDPQLPTTYEGEVIKRNAILVFLPGRGEIATVANNLRAIQGLPNNIDVIQLHSKSTEADKINVKTIPRDTIRIILATNVVESSVTIDYLDVVIDSMLEKVMVYDQSNQSKKLILTYISKNSSKQRAGRVGRNRVGMTIRIISEENFDQLDDSKPNNIITNNVDKTVVEVMANSPRRDVGGEPIDIKILTYMGITKIRINSSLQHATRLRLLNNNRGVYTIANIDLINDISKLPLDLMPAYLLANWSKDKKYPTYVGIVLACLIDSNIRYINTNVNKEDVEEFLRANDLWSYGIIGESINIWQYITARYRTVEVSEGDIYKAFPNSISDGESIIDVLELKRLGRSISSCIGIITKNMRDDYHNEVNNLNTIINDYKTELSKENISESSRMSMTDKLQNARSDRSEIRKLMKQPIEMGSFDEDYAIRALGYFLQRKLDISRIATAYVGKKSTSLTSEDGIKYIVPNNISTMMRIKTGNRYIIIGSVIIGDRNLVTLMIPPYHVLDGVINKRLSRRTRSFQSQQSIQDPIYSQQRRDERSIQLSQQALQPPPMNIPPQQVPTQRIIQQTQSPMYSQQRRDTPSYTQQVQQIPQQTQQAQQTQSPTYSQQRRDTPSYTQQVQQIPQQTQQVQQDYHNISM